MNQKIHIWFLAMWNNKLFGDSLYTRNAKIVKAEEKRNSLLENIVDFNGKSKPSLKAGKDKKRHTYENEYALYERVKN